MSHIIFLCHSRRPSNHTHDVHLHVMQCSHQQQRMTCQIFCISCHFNKGPRDTPHQQGCNAHISNNKWHIKFFAFHVISTGVHVRPHVSKGTNEKTDVLALPAKNLFTWSWHVLHVFCSGNHGKPCFMWCHIKNELNLDMLSLISSCFWLVNYNGF